MVVNGEMLESELFRYLTFTKGHSVVRYVNAALQMFVEHPLVHKDGSLEWSSQRFVSSRSVTSEAGGDYGYNPLPCMLRALDRLGDDASKLSVIYDRWARRPKHSRDFETATLEKLFIERAACVTLESFLVGQATFGTGIKKAVVGLARVIRDAAPSYRWQRSVYDSFFGPLRLYTPSEETVVLTCQRALGIGRRSRSCKHDVTVRNEPLAWRYKWQDCALIDVAGRRFYERRDERLRWISVLLWQCLQGRLDFDVIPVDLLLQFDAADDV